MQNRWLRSVDSEQLAITKTGTPGIPETVYLDKPKAVERIALQLAEAEAPTSADVVSLDNPSTAQELGDIALSSLQPKQPAQTGVVATGALGYRDAAVETAADRAGPSENLVAARPTTFPRRLL